MLTAARFWPQRWFAVRTMPQDLIGCWNQRKLKALIPVWCGCFHGSSGIGREKDRFCCLLLLLYGLMIGKIILFLNMCHWNSENSGGCSYLLRICFICGTNVSVLQSWILLQVADREQGAFWFTNQWVQIKILSFLKLVSFESLAGNDFSERGSQAETHCKRNLSRQLWSIRWKISHPCSRNFCTFYHKS